MLRTTLLGVLVALMIGCGKKAPNSSPEQAETPKGGDPKNPTPPTDPNAGKPKDQPKVLTPVGVVKTGMATGPGDRNQVHLSEDGSVAAVYNGRVKKTQIWKVSADPKKIQEFAGNVLCFSPDGTKLLRSGKDFQPQEIVAAETGALIVPLENKSHSLTTFSSPDVVVGLTPGDWLEPQKPGTLLVRHYNATTGKMMSEFEIPTGIQGKNFVFFNQGKELAIGSQKDNRVEFWDLINKKKSREVTLANPPAKPANADLRWFHFTVGQDGKWIALERNSGNRIFDATTGAEATPQNVGNSTGSLLPNRDIYLRYQSKFDAKTSTGMPTYHAYDFKKAAVVASLPMPQDGLFHTLSANGKTLITESDNGQLTVWDLTQIP